MTIFGGADGPISIFATSNMGWLNWFGFVMRHWPLTGFAAVFGAAHIDITVVNGQEAA